MALLRAAQAQETYLKDGVYRSEFLQWKGFVDRIPILRAILNANADAVTASWRTEGKEAKKMADVLDQFEGNGKETFKLIMNNAIKIAKIGGDYYGEIIYGEFDGIDGEIPLDIITLPPANILQIVKKGRIKRYEEIDGDAKWSPQEMFHLAYNPIGAQTHGNSMIEPMQNILIDLENIMDVGSKIYEHYVKPLTIIYAQADTQAELDKIKDSWKSTMQTIKSDWIIPADVIQKIERHGIPQFSTLDPAHWHRVLLDHVIMSSRVPELALGTGAVNSEESARMQFMGFRQMIRWEQKFLEENLRRQLFVQIFPDDTPDIKFSFGTEAQEERLNRLRNDFQTVSAAELDPQFKILLQTKLLIDMGVIENV